MSKKIGPVIIISVFGLLVCAYIYITYMSQPPSQLPAERIAGTSTGILTGKDLSIDGDTIAFTTDAHELNGDGLTSGPVIRYYTISTGEVTNTEALGWLLSLDGNIIAFEYRESETSVDLNGDGDTTDHLIGYYDITTGEATNTGVVGTSPSLYGNMIAFHTPESEIGLDGTDLNEDGDLEDHVIRCYDITTGTVRSIGMGGDPSLDGNMIAFHTHEEFDAGEDLNGDGDTEDYVVRCYDITTGTVTNTGITGVMWSLSLDGNTVAYNRAAGEYSIGYYDISTGTVTRVIKGVWGVSVDGNTIAFSIMEQSQFGVGMDLNGDGDTDDSVIGYYVIGVDEPAD